MVRVTSIALTVSLCLPAVGCVTRAKHDDALRELESARATAQQRGDDLVAGRKSLAEREAHLVDLQGALAAQEQSVAALTAEKVELQREIDEVRGQLASLEARATSAERGLAEMVKRRAGLKESLARMTAALAEVGERQLTAEKRVAEYRDMLARFRTMIDAGTLDVRIVDGRMVLTLPVDILFASDSTRLSSDGKHALGQVGAALASIVDKRFQVEGHTDDVPIRTERFASNWELASGRALVVVHALLDAGVAPKQLSAASFAEYEPRLPNADEASRALNRRIEISVVPDLTGLPGADELERLSHGK